MLLRIRPPSGRQIIGDRAGDTELKPGARGTVDITGLQGNFTVRFNLKKVIP
jgi:hypothetical protein